MFRFKSADSTLGVDGSAVPARNTIYVGIVEDEILNQEAEDEVPPLALLPPLQEDTPLLQSTSIPPWIRELNNSQTTRHSRASSIVSTRTKFSTTTLQDDARSIDINAGGQHFRISRDGSHITADPPPPYTAPIQLNPRHMGQARSIGTTSLESPHSLRFRHPEENENVDPDYDGASTPRSTLVGPNMVRLSEDISGIQPNTWLTEAVQLLERPLSATLDRPALMDEEVRATTDHVHHETSTLAGGDEPSTISSSSPTATTDLTRPSSLAMPADNNTQVNTQLYLEHGSPPLGGGGPHLQPASVIILPNVHTSPSSRVMEESASAVAPYSDRSNASTSASNGDEPTAIASDATFRLVDRESQGSVVPYEDDNDTPLSMDDENEISLHYARMMRKLDYGHRKALHLKDKELAELREKLHEKDIVLRQQLRAKDFMIDDLKKRLDTLEETTETMLERARNKVEDLWEIRWKARSAQLLDRMKRIEEDARTAIESVCAERAHAQRESSTQ
ncbi:hypothetical protein A1O3_06042 [Capronia epimyces CBS 606.96]|uniref:Uncharacterized protein n=1 Tax=Capronia epimyces CBS 606.96 TaxID=1182542 RepID=W9YIV8_9EURO|nr:uncharacterized protein A1O3_06042 [Capronia epimyces CBS 606.96]EXJ82229.1 hypothetical protein A1O3_06042 [Capronia epimyces CBS 606.96]